MTRRSLGLLLGVLAVGSAAVNADEIVQVAAASSLAPVLPLLQKDFAAAQPGFQVQVNLGSSGALVTQLLNGGPGQVFLSVDLDFPQKLVAGGWAAGPVHNFARGSLILLVKTARDLSKGLTVLTAAEIQHVALANPETAPFGRAAQQALQALGLWDQVKAKVVQAQSVQQAFQLTVQAAEAGFVSRSVLSSPEGQTYDHPGQNWIAVDPKLYKPLDNGYVVKTTEATKPAVQAFVAYLTSARAGRILQTAGYQVPGQY